MYIILVGSFGGGICQGFRAERQHMISALMDRCIDAATTEQGYLGRSVYLCFCGDIRSAMMYA